MDEKGAGILIYYKELLTIAISAAIGTVMTWYIKRQFAMKEKKDAEIQKLLDEREKMKEEAIREWRLAYMRGQDSIKEKMELIITQLNAKVGRLEWEKHEHELKDQIKDLDRRAR